MTFLPQFWANKGNVFSSRKVHFSNGEECYDCNIDVVFHQTVGYVVFHQTVGSPLISSERLLYTFLFCISFCVQCYFPRLWGISISVIV